jgi:hypothetical protein
MQILTYSDGKLGVAIIPDRLRRLLNTEAEKLSENTALLADYHSADSAATPPQLPHDRLSIFSMPAHGSRPEYLVRFQRGRLSWAVLVLGIDSLMDFDKRYIQSFVQNLVAATARDLYPIKESLESLTNPSI